MMPMGLLLYLLVLPAYPVWIFRHIASDNPANGFFVFRFGQSRLL